MPPPQSVRTSVLWHETSDPVEVPAASLADDLDVVVVGSGYCGLAAATTAATGGRRVSVLDAGPLGIGASTRNGGMVIPELKWGPGTLVARCGELGRRMQADVDEAFDWLEALIAEEGIDCAYARSGQLYLAHAERAVPGLEDLAAQHRAIGHDAALLRGADLAAEIGSTRFPAGLALARTGGLHPARLHAGLVARARRAGVDPTPSTGSPGCVASVAATSSTSSPTGASARSGPGR